ncbi:DUF3040 domain-containing protein [Streptomyces apocyni]|uniref:DUF3040 domain-containing protein n=1 Tax=Streptomyces apocyni TaxID=2654677 RepID=UPI0012EA98F0|nr:DUF3040 domain-containing protein [Streptomyces apocyni]
MTKALSRRERMLLAQIEDQLREDDAALDRCLRSMLPAPAPTGALYRIPGVALYVLVPAAVALLATAVATSSPVLIAAFAGVWALTFACLVLLVCRWSRRNSAERRGRGEADGGDGGKKP